MWEKKMNTLAFSPNLISDLLVKSAIQEIKALIVNKDKYKLFNLGSGGGHVGVTVAKSLASLPACVQLNQPGVCRHYPILQLIKTL
jgi:hypothetical protein